MLKITTMPNVLILVTLTIAIGITGTTANPPRGKFHDFKIMIEILIEEYKRVRHRYI